MSDTNKATETDTIALDEAAGLIAKTAGYDLAPYSDEYTRERLNRYLLGSQPTPRTPAPPHRQIGQLSRQDVISALSLNVTTMFRDPVFYRILKQQVLPTFQHKKHLLIWEIGCSTGEEAYSLAITLNEAGWRERHTIIATDFNRFALERARVGRYDIKKAGTFTHNYYAADGQSSFSNYYSTTADFLEIDPFLRRHIIFREADVTIENIDFCPDLIICRNVIFYFSRSQQIETLDLFSRSLKAGGYLCIGSKEPVPAHNLEFEMIEISQGGRIFAINRRDRSMPHSPKLESDQGLPSSIKLLGKKE